MCKRLLIPFVLLMLGIGAPAALAQQTPAPAQTPKPEQKAKPGKPVPAPEATPRPSYQSGEPVQVEPVILKLARGGKVVISSRAGEIVVSGWDKDVVQATATSDGGPEQIETQTTGDASHPRLMLTAPASGRRFGREVRFEIKVPRYADLETLEGHRGDIQISDVDGATLVNAGNGDVKIFRVGPLKVSRRAGDVTVREVKGDLTARGFTGDIVVENVTGLVDVAATNGDLSIHNAGADVRANSATGDIEVRCAKGRADVSSASGSITLTGVAGDAEASTASGEVLFTGNIHANGTYRLKSLSGEVVMTIQPDAPGFTATLSTYSGGLDTEFPLKVESPLQRGPINRRLTGHFGDGQAKISLDSFSGTVKIAKGTAAVLKVCK